jgi:predicted nucleic acid-binding protein
MAEYIVITDTSCLILLDNIRALDLLHIVYPYVLTTPEIAAEFKKALPEWIQVIPVKNIELIAIYVQQVDLGEASAIALAQEVPDALLIVDDLKGRRLATQLNMKFTGTIGVLITARQQNKIISLRPYFELVRSTDFRIDPMLLERILNDFND